MKKALLVTSVASMIKQFNMDNIQILKSLGYEVSVATNFKEPGTIPLVESQRLKKELNDIDVITYDISFTRNPFSVKNIKAYKKIKELMTNEIYNVVHCQSPVGGLITRLAYSPQKMNETKVIYTAHGFHFFNGSPIKNWLIYYPIEYLLTKKTDLLLTINQEDYDRAKKMPFKKVAYIPGVGINLSDDFDKNQKNKVLKKEFNIDKNKVIITSVGELNKNKNHKIVLKALSRLKDKEFVYLICGKGIEKENLKLLANKLEISEKIKILGYRNDVVDILKGSDIFVFPSFREGLPVSVLEAMDAKLPIICTEIRGNTDLIDEGKGGYLVTPYDEEKIVKKLAVLLNNKELRKKMGHYNKLKCMTYSNEKVNALMREIYK